MQSGILPYENTLPEIASGVYLAPFSLVVGQVRIGEDSSIWPMSVVRGDVHHIRIGQRSNIQDGSILHVTHDGQYSPGGSPLIIGDEVTIGHQVMLHACQIGNRCLIGMGSIVLDRAIIEDDVMLGAGSLVNQGACLESGYLYFGRPAKKIRLLSDTEMEQLRYSAMHYVRLKDRYLKQTEL